MIQQWYAKRNSQEKKIILIAVIVIAIACFDRLLFSPALGELKNKDDEIQTEESRIKRDLRFLAYKERINKDYKLYSRYIPKHTGDVDDINADFLKSIEKLATLSKVNLVKSQPIKNDSKKGYAEFYANVDCTGRLEDIVAFMHMIDSSDELLSVVKYNLNAQRNNPDLVNISMTVLRVVVSPDKT